uniref:Nuclear pore protein n=1 Tax=Syphacia muris TaxID=451379 RepID=A0A0N5AQG2_9BILA
MSISFDDLLHRADKLSSTVLSSGKTVGTTIPNENSILDVALDDIFQCSEKLWQKKKGTDKQNAELQASLLLNESGYCLGALPGCWSRKESSGDSFNDEKNMTSTQSNTVLEDAVDATSELAALEAERAFFNQRVIDTAHLNMKSKSAILSGKTSNVEEVGVVGKKLSPSTVDRAFANAISDYISDRSTTRLASGFKEAALMERDEDITAIWEQGIALVSSNVAARGDVTKYRSSPEYHKHVVDAAVQYLQKHFVSHMKQVVERNLALARRGGVPSTLSLIDAYLNVKHVHNSPQNTQDGVYGNNAHPIWEVVYYCLRAGDFSAASTIASSHLKNLPSCAAASLALTSLGSSNKLSAEIRQKLVAEWKSEKRMCTDVHKKAIYCSLLGEDAPDICDNLESWLWLKLTPMYVDEIISPEVFAELRRLISHDYGEDYFVGEGGSSTLFFQALWLTGQLERAIDVLYRSDRLLHAVHLAVLAYVNGFLLVTEDIGLPILSISADDLLQSSLNFSRLILLFVKPFECTDVDRSLDYFYFLNKMESPTGGNLFYACISRAVYLSGETERILGRVDDKRGRVEGLIDKYPNISVKDAIAKVASDTEIGGDVKQAVLLFYAADRKEDCLRLTCDYIAKEMMNPNESLEARELAIWVANMYRASAESSIAEMLATLFLLIDFSTFMLNFSEGRYSLCMSILSKLKCIPLHPDDVQSYVSLFHMLADQVRLVLPDICLAVMKLLVEENSKKTTSSEELKQHAKAIILYAAMVPYRFPSQINAQILQLNTQLG